MRINRNIPGLACVFLILTACSPSQSPASANSGSPLGTTGSPADSASTTTVSYSEPQSPIVGRVLFTIEQRDVVNRVAFIDADGLHLLPTTTDLSQGSAIWDGPDHVIFVGEHDGQHHLYRMSLDGTDLTQLTSGDESQDLPAISADGSRIAYGDYREQQAQDLGIHTADADGSHVVALTEPGTPGSHEGYDCPAFSPDGKWIAYNHIVDDVHALAELWIMRSDGTQQRRLTAAKSSASHPRFSPDGSKISFTSHVEGGGGVLTGPLLIVPTAGGTVAPLTDPADTGTAWEGVWSPSGDQIVFMYYREGWDHNELRIANSDGSNARTLWVSPALGSAERPDWAA